MRNLNEPRNPIQAQAEVIPLESRRTAKAENSSVLKGEHEMEALRVRWTAIQSEFVDDPQQSVQQADELVTSVIQQISEGFRSQRAQLEKQWSGGGEASTEDLRVALQQYRAFFDRLLSM